jgi:hypothetical protein
VISGFRRDVDENCGLLGYYEASSANPLPTFRDNVSVPFSRMKSWTSWPSLPLRMGPINCPETSVKDYHSTFRNIPEGHRSDEISRPVGRGLTILFVICKICHRNSK